MGCISQKALARPTGRQSMLPACGRDQREGDPPLQLHCSPGSIDQTEQSPQSSPESAYREAILGSPEREAWHMAF